MSLTAAKGVFRRRESGRERMIIEKERERESARMSRGGTKGERENPKQAAYSVLSPTRDLIPLPRDRDVS